MKRPRTVLAIVGLAFAASSGGVASAATNAGPAPTHRAAVVTSAKKHLPTTVHTATAKVQGATETILVNAKRLPLYIYKAETSTKSLVAGGLAALWPPLTATTPTATGLSSPLTGVTTSNGHQVAYKGHLLYTFIDDSPGHVTGQGVQDFFVATPKLAANGGKALAHQTTVAPTHSSYGY
jgi:predicted lipoprotein with Yx(FWY)xxD motif